MTSKEQTENHKIMGAVGNDSIVVGHTVKLVWRRGLWGSNISFINFDVLEELQQGVRRAVSDENETTYVFEWVSRWLSVSGQGVGVFLHSSVPRDGSTIVTREVVLMEMR